MVLNKKRIISVLSVLIMVICVVPMLNTGVFSDSENTPLTLVCKGESAEITFLYNEDETEGLQFRIGNGEWRDYTQENTDSDKTIVLNSNQNVSFRAKKILTSSTKHFIIESDCVEAFGNIMSLMCGDSYDTFGTTCYENNFEYMFSGCKSLTSAPQLPSTELAPNCYGNMFSGCIRLKSAPELPATILKSNCYQYMFSGCSELINVSDLKAVKLADRCCVDMFSKCTSLKSAPKLPSTELEESCYSNMFNGCTSLKNIQELPALKLAPNCYNLMFNECRSLTSMPTLPAMKMEDHCYNYMFSKCTSLTNVSSLPATELKEYCYNNMFSGCSSLKKAPKLPATNLCGYCYNAMFSGCSSLKSAPVLLATEMVECCYKSMFDGCSSLTKAPELPATILNVNCYYGMFKGCSSLTKAPELPALKLEKACYSNMFNGCSSLTKIPKLLATTLANNCYYNMFANCTGFSIYKNSIPEESIEWVIPSGEIAGESNWNMNMFNKVGGDLNGDKIEKGVIYHILPAVIGVRLNKNKIYMFCGQSEKLVETISPLDVLNKDVRWSSLNPSVAKVSNEGEVTGVSSGKTIINVTTVIGGETATCEVIVQSPMQNTSSVPLPNRTEGNYSDIPTERGNIKNITDSKEVINENNILGVKIDNSDNLETLLNVTPEEKEKGVNAWIVVNEIKEVDMDVIEKKLIDTTISKDNRLVGLYINAEVFKKVGDDNAEKVTDTNGDVEISFVLPTDFNADGKKLYLCRVHENVTEYIPLVYNEITRECTFSSNKFSTYVIVYDNVELIRNKDNFEKYKKNRISDADKLKKTYTFDGIGKMIDKAKKDIKAITYDNKKNIDENKKVIDERYNMLLKDLKTLKGKREAYLKFIASIKVYTIDEKINIKWGKVSSGSGYFVYANYCGSKKMKKVKTITSNKITSYDIKEIGGKKINNKKSFKLYVSVYKKEKDKKKVLFNSMVVHVVGSKHTKYSNAKNIRLDKSSYSLKVGKNVTIKGNLILYDKNKKQLDKSHGKTLRFESSDLSVVTVSSNGKITAKSKGNAIIYVYTFNGYTKKVKITVK